MTNQDIVNYVYKNYNVLKLVRKLIRNSKDTHIDGEIEQYIYMELLVMDNKKLEEMFLNNKLKNYICRAIINQRNSGRYLNKFIKNNLIEYVDELPEVEENDDKFDYRADFLFDELESINWYSIKNILDPRKIISKRGKKWEELSNVQKWRLLKKYRESQDVERKAFGYELLKLHIGSPGKTGKSKLELMLEFNIGISRLNMLLREAKNNLKSAYDKEFKNYKNNEFWD